MAWRRYLFSERSERDKQACLEDAYSGPAQYEIRMNGLSCAFPSPFQPLPTRSLTSKSLSHSDGRGEG
jgi:hypothetical protein